VPDVELDDRKARDLALGEALLVRIIAGSLDDLAILLDAVRPEIGAHQVFDGPQAAALGSVQELTHPEAGAYRIVGAPIRLDAEALPYPSPAPSLGADTREVLIGLGLSAGQIDDLVEAGTAIAP